MTGNHYICRKWILIVLVLQLPAFNALAETDEQLPEQMSSDDEIVSYPATFFQRYQPDTALDMITVLPGFQLNEGQDKRGFGSAAGNVLINDIRPSSKQDTISTILGRISASNVERIEVIRSQVRNIDLGGYSIVANVHLLEEAKSLGRWELKQEKNFRSLEPYALGGNVVLSNTWLGTDYTVGFTGNKASYSQVGPNDVFDGDMLLIEQQSDEWLTRGEEFSVNLNTVSEIKDTLIQTNLKWRDSSLTGDTLSVRTPRLGTPRDENFIDETDTKQLEIGANTEKSLTTNLSGKSIVLFTRERVHLVSDQTTLDDTGTQIFFRSADSNQTSKELIARTEFNWSGIQDHAIQVNLEGALNILDGTLAQVEDTGGGPVNVPVPGGNTRVEEVRGDFLVRDNWRLGQFELAYGMGAEVSTITQTGDVDLERSFFFAKPEGTLTYTHDPQQQWRLRVAKEVSQLNFDDFISATVFEDDDLALGNPDLQPEATWITELSHERRFGEFGVMTLTAFHNWISNVEDFLPLSPTFEAPGNIGDGRRWGLELEGTLSLDWLMLTQARLDIKARWQDSTVIDPVTGMSRVLSGAQEPKRLPEGYPFLRNESKYALILDFRQDFRESKVSWGWTMFKRDKRPYFRVNEFEELSETIKVNAFIETTRWFGIKIRLFVRRVFNSAEKRFRTIYTGERGLSGIDSFIDRERYNGREVELTFSGTF